MRYWGPLLCLVAALLPALGAADGDAVVIGVEDLPYLPYYAVERGDYRGHARELLDSWAADLGRQIRYRPLPVERLYLALVHGDIDAKYPDNPDWRPDLKARYDVVYSRPVARFTDGVMVLASRAAEDAAAFARIGTVRGFTPWALLPLVGQGTVTVSENSSMPGLLRQVLEGRVDGAYLNVAVAGYQLRGVDGEASALVLSPRLPSSTSHYRLSSVRKPALIQSFDAWLDTHAERVGELRRKWGIAE